MFNVKRTLYHLKQFKLRKSGLWYNGLQRTFRVAIVLRSINFAAFSIPVAQLVSRRSQDLVSRGLSLVQLVHGRVDLVVRDATAHVPNTQIRTAELRYECLPRNALVFVVGQVGNFRSEQVFLESNKTLGRSVALNLGTFHVLFA